LLLRPRFTGDKMPPPRAGAGPREPGLSLAKATVDEGSGRRLAALDIARGLAIVAMVVYHTAYDLSSARLIATDVAGNPGWTVFARLIAGSFLFLVGVNLVLATERGIAWPAYLRRLGLIVGGAALVTLSTWWFDSRSFVFFGILHAIAVASVLALPFLRLQNVVVAAAAASVLVLPLVFKSSVFNRWPLWWVGLQTEPLTSVDYVPVFPWFGVVLAGIVGGRFVAANRERIATWRPGGTSARWLSFAGRWSLLIYLVHQPLIVGAVSLAANLIPPNEAIARANFMGQCQSACSQDAEAGTCAAFCGCMFDGLWGTDLFDKNSLEEMAPDQRTTFDALFASCRAPPAN
jgi:uncharacterized membrane protein